MYNEKGSYPDTVPLKAEDKAPRAGNYSYFFIKPNTNNWQEMADLERQAGEHGAVLAIPTKRGVLVTIANSDDEHFKEVYKDHKTVDITHDIQPFQNKYPNASITYVLTEIGIIDRRELEFELTLDHLGYDPEEIKKYKAQKIQEAQIIRNQQKEEEKEEAITTKVFVDNYERIIHSEGFIEKFGDWEKAQRLEKAKDAPIIEKDGEIVIDGKSITEDIKQARAEKDIDQLRIYANKIGKSVRGIYQVTDLNNEDIQVVRASSDEIKQHNIDKYINVEAIKYIPDFIDKGIFISSEKNEDIITHADIDKYEYLLSGLNVNGDDYTVKSVIAVQKNGDKYYDQHLSKIEKGRLLSDLTRITNSESLNNLPYDLDDKRLLRVCQVSQRPYLDENLKPTHEAVSLVQEGKLYLEKDPITGYTSMCNENESDHKILQFRNMFNAQQEAHEPKITYENAKTILTNSNYSFEKISFSKDRDGIESLVNVYYGKNEDGFDIYDDLTPKELLDKCKIENVPNIKKLKEQNRHAEECTTIIKNWMVACDALGESNDFNNVMKHAKNSFRQNIENAKENLTETDVQFRKDQFEYFKHYATPLFNKAEKEHEIDLLITNIDYEDKFNELTKENKSLKEEIEKQNQKLKEQNQLLHGHCFIPVNGIKREIKNGLMNAFPEAVKRIHEANQKIQDLSQNKSINKKLNNSNGIEM